MYTERPKRRRHTHTRAGGAGPEGAVAVVVLVAALVDSAAYYRGENTSPPRPLLRSSCAADVLVLCVAGGSLALLPLPDVRVLVR